MILTIDVIFILYLCTEMVSKMNRDEVNNPCVNLGKIRRLESGSDLELFQLRRVNSVRYVYQWYFADQYKGQVYCTSV